MKEVPILRIRKKIPPPDFVMEKNKEATNRSNRMEGKRIIKQELERYLLEEHQEVEHTL